MKKIYFLTAVLIASCCLLAQKKNENDTSKIESTSTSEMQNQEPALDDQTSLDESFDSLEAIEGSSVNASIDDERDDEDSQSEEQSEDVFSGGGSSSNFEPI